MDALNLIIHNALTSLGWTGEATARLCLAALLGGVVGLEREWRGREAGFRTNLLVALGCSLAMLVSGRLAEYPWSPTGDYNVNVDPGRIAYGVMTGVGFLGAGTIMKHQYSVRGLTTAAALWCVSAIGLAVGQGLYVLGMAATVLVLAALWLFAFVEHWIPGMRVRRLVIRCPWESGCVPGLIGRIRRPGLDVVEQAFTRTDDLTHVDVELTITYGDSRRYEALEAELHENGGCVLISSQRV